MINWFLCWLLWLSPPPKPQSAHTFTPYPGVPDHAECTGTCQSDTLPTSYKTPPSWDFCKNARTDGPTPCWFPSCVINEEAHGVNDGW